MKNTRDLYRVHPSVAYARTIITNLKEKTGKTLGEWEAVIRERGPEDSKDSKKVRAWLKSEFGLGMTTVSLIANAVSGAHPEAYDEDSYLDQAVEYVNVLYSGKKSHLRLIHDRLLSDAYALGSDVAASPCSTIVPLYRKRVFAQVKPSTLTRVDLGLALKDCTEPLSKRLVDTGGLQKGDRITHRIPISDESEVDDETRFWLRVAYELDD